MDIIKYLNYKYKEKKLKLCSLQNNKSRSLVYQEVYPDEAMKTEHFCCVLYM